MAENPDKPSSVELDLRRYELRRGTRVLKLEKIPMELLILLAQNRDRLVGREEIIKQLWGKDVFLTDRVIYTHINNVRRKIEVDPAHPKLLVGVRGVGYRFDG